MDCLETLQLFIRIVEFASFSRAAEALSVPRATATYAIKQLEARLGTRLLERTTRQVRPTLDGQAYYERCVVALGELDEAEGALRNLAANPRGTLRVDMSGTHATQIVLPRIDEFRQRYPRIDLVLSCGDRLIDLVREGVDCVIRAGVPKDSALVARRLARMPQVLCASPEYLALRGLPQTPDELTRHDSIGFFSSGNAVDHSLDLVVDGEQRAFTSGGWMAVNDAESYVAAALRGCGLIQVPRYHIEEHLKGGRLVEVLPGWRSPDLPVSALYPQHRQLSPRVRIFIDWLVGVYADRFAVPTV
jgi:DNA-binding transcriptional LysR family regulator